MTKKKDFTTRETVDTVRTIATNDTPETKDTKDTAKAEYRYNARFTMKEWAYLTEKKWRTRQSITAILQNLIDEDMEKHPEIVETIDELNT